MLGGLALVCPKEGRQVTNEQFNQLQKGDEVVVRKSAKIYRVTFICEPESEEEFAALKQQSAERGVTYWRERLTVRSVSFQQVRANSKGVVGLYGPSTHLKAANIEVR